MAFIRNTDRLIEGSSKLFFSDIRAKAAVQSDLDLLASDISAEESARMSEDSGIKLRLDVIEGGAGVSGSIAKAQADAQAYADQKVAALVNSAPEVLDTLKELSDALGGDANFATTIAGQVGDVDAKVDQEILDRQTAISGVEASLASEVASLESQIETEQLARQSDVSGLDGRLDSLEQDPVTKSYVDGEIAELDGMFSSFQGDFDGRLDVLEGSGEGSVAKAEQDAKDYADSLDSAMDARMQVLESDPVTKTYVDGEVSDLQGQITQEISDRQTAVSAEETRAMAAESALDGRLDILEQDPTTKSYVDGEVSDLQGQITQEISDRQSAISGVQGEVEAEETRAMAAESALSGRLDTLELDPVTKTYVDGEVSDLQGQVNTEKGRIDAILSASEADKDSFAEIVSLINSVDTANDSAFAGYVLSNDAALAQEVTDRQTGDLNLQNNIDGLFASKTTSDLAEGSRLYFTDARARSASVVNSSAGSQTDQAMSVSSAKSYIDTADNARLKLDGTSAMTGAVNFSSAFTLSQGGSAVLTSVNSSSPLQVNRGMRVPVAAVTNNMTVAVASGFLHGVQSLSAPRTISLPSASAMGMGRMLVFKDETGAASNTNYIRIQAVAGQKIDGEDYYDIVVPYESVMIYASGNNWFII